MNIYFIGAGPGAEDLITVRGLNLINKADIIIYAGSLVNPALLKGAKSGAQILDSASMNLDQVQEIFLKEKNKSGVIARVHTGDPTLYGAIQEQIDFCKAHGLEWQVVPGVSSFAASSAALGQELTLPGVSQSVIITRRAGRTPVPKGESISSFASHGATMCIFLSIQKMGELIEELKEGAYTDETPMAVVYRASWEDQIILRGTLTDMEEKVTQRGINRQAMIVVGPVLASEYELSKLYDREFSHGFRRGSDPEQLPQKGDPYGTPQVK